MNKNFYKILLIIIIFLNILVLCNQVKATSLEVGLGYGAKSGLGVEDVRLTVANIIKVSLGLLGIIAVIIILYGGFLYMVNKDDPEKVGKAKKLLISAGTGFALILVAYGITSFILSKLLEATGVEMINSAGNYNGPSGNNNNGNEGPTPPDQGFSDYQAYYSFDNGGIDSSTNHFDGTVYNYSGGTLTPDPTAVSGGNLNLDGSHFIRINNFSIGPSFTAIARVKSDTAVWNTDGWIISTQNGNGFLVHSNSGTKNWSGYVYSKTGSRASYILVGTYSMPGNVNITDWHTYGLQYDSTAHVAKLIFDGQVVVTTPIVIDRGTTNSNITIDIGHDLFTATGRFGKGVIDWVYIYNSVLY